MTAAAHPIQNGFRRLAAVVAHSIGSPLAFGLAFLTIVVWAVLGPAFHYSDTWQLVINTGTTIVTFLDRVPDPEHAEPRQPAIHLKLDELIRAVTEAVRNGLVDLEELPEADLAKLEQEFRRLSTSDVLPGPPPV